MKPAEHVMYSISLLVLNDLHHSKAIGDDVYDKAVQKIREIEPGLPVPAATEKEIA